jgi:plastocyanin
MRRALVVCAAVAALTLLSACSGGGSGAAVKVSMQNFRFRPVDLQIASGQDVAFVNGTQTLHNFTLINGGQVSFDVPPGQTVTTDEVGALKPGTYRFKCRYHLNQGMIGVLFVTSSSGSSAP